MSVSSILARINLQRGQLPFQQQKRECFTALTTIHPLCFHHFVGAGSTSLLDKKDISDSKAEYLFSSNPCEEVFTLGPPAGNWLSGGTGELNSWYSRDRFMQLQSRGGGPYGPLSYNINSIMNSIQIQISQSTHLTKWRSGELNSWYRDRIMQLGSPAV